MSPSERVRQAAAEVLAAFAARPDADEYDHPEGLTKADVELAWQRWSLRQDASLIDLRTALAVGLPDDCPTCGHVLDDHVHYCAEELASGTCSCDMSWAPAGPIEEPS